MAIIILSVVGFYLGMGIANRNNDLSVFFGGMAAILSLVCGVMFSLGMIGV